MVYKMVKENVDCDLCELLRQKLLDKLRLTKIEMYPFWYGSLIMCLVFYLLNVLTILNHIACRRDVLVSAQIRGYLDNLDNCGVSCHNFFFIYSERVDYNESNSSEDC